jgi:hypothetical protein
MRATSLGIAGPRQRAVLRIGSRDTADAAVQRVRRSRVARYDNPGKLRMTWRGRDAFAGDDHATSLIDGCAATAEFDAARGSGIQQACRGTRASAEGRESRVLDCGPAASRFRSGSERRLRHDALPSIIGNAVVRRMRFQRASACSIIDTGDPRRDQPTRSAPWSPDHVARGDAGFPGQPPFASPRETTCAIWLW